MFTISQVLGSCCFQDDRAWQGLKYGVRYELRPTSLNLAPLNAFTFPSNQNGEPSNSNAAAINNPFFTPVSSEANPPFSDYSSSRPSSSLSESSDSGCLSEDVVNPWFVNPIRVPSHVRTRHASECLHSVRSRHTSESSSPGRSRHVSEGSPYVRSRHTSESASAISQDEYTNCLEHNLSHEYYCKTCSQDVCKQCLLNLHNSHEFEPGTTVRQLFKEIEWRINQVDDLAAANYKQQNRLNVLKYETSQSIKTCFQNLHEVLYAREHQLRERVKYTTDCRAKILKKKHEIMTEQADNSKRMMTELAESYRKGDMDFVNRCGAEAKKMLESLRDLCKQMRVEEEDVCFVPPSDHELNWFKNLCSISSSSNGVKTTCNNSVFVDNNREPFVRPNNYNGVPPPSDLQISAFKYTNVKPAQEDYRNVSFDPLRSFNPPTLTKSPATTYSTPVPPASLPGLHNIAKALASLPTPPVESPCFPAFPQHFSAPVTPNMPSPPHVERSPTHANANIDMVMRGMSAGLANLRMRESPFPHAESSLSNRGKGYGRNDRSISMAVGVHTARRYHRIRKPVIIFGAEGSGNDELCRPWGVCCDKLGHVIVADRSNNRIQIFRTDGTHVRNFGSFGVQEGQFNRPAGVAIDLKGNIIICDKDNHRIQVMSIEGTFIRVFGSRGSALGSFNYPWDVAVHPFTNNYAISDTRNHRVQIFNDLGLYVASFGYAAMPPIWEPFDSPRGLCFTPQGTLLVTDFNTHRLYEVEMRKVMPFGCSYQARIINFTKYVHFELFRPQKVTMDQEENILISDCRNNRIQVYSRNGQLMASIGVAGKEPGQFDRPSGIAMTPDGKLVVVDFGNNRIQVF